VMQQNNDRLRRLVRAMVERLPQRRACSCATALAGARVE